MGGYWLYAWGAYEILLFTNHLDVGQEIINTHQMVRGSAQPGALPTIDPGLVSFVQGYCPGCTLTAAEAIAPFSPPPKVTTQFSQQQTMIIPADAAPSEPAEALTEPAEPTESGKPTPDRSFGKKGAVLASFQGEPSDAQAMCVQPDGYLIVADGVGSAGSASDIAVARFLPDSTFPDRRTGL